MLVRELLRRFPNCSKSTLAANCGEVDIDSVRVGLPNAKPKEQAGALGSNHEREAPRTGCPAVCFTLRRVRLLDIDAKYGSIKDLLDGLQYAGLVRGDREGEITLEVRQEKVARYKDEKTIIEITYP